MHLVIIMGEAGCSETGHCVRSLVHAGSNTRDVSRQGRTTKGWRERTGEIEGNTSGTASTITTSLFSSLMITFTLGQILAEVDQVTFKRTFDHKARPRRTRKVW